MEPTTLGIIMVATVGAVKLFDGLVAIIKLLIARNGKGSKLGRGAQGTQTLLENQFVSLMDAKQDKPVCDEKHKAVDEKTTVLFQKVDSMADKINEIHICVIKGD